MHPKPDDIRSAEEAVTSMRLAFFRLPFCGSDAIQEAKQQLLNAFEVIEAELDRLKVTAPQVPPCG